MIRRKQHSSLSCRRSRSSTCLLYVLHLVVVAASLLADVDMEQGQDEGTDDPNVAAYFHPDDEFDYYHPNGYHREGDELAANAVISHDQYNAIMDANTGFFTTTYIAGAQPVDSTYEFDSVSGGGGGVDIQRDYRRHHVRRTQLADDCFGVPQRFGETLYVFLYDAFALVNINSDFVYLERLIERVLKGCIGDEAAAANDCVDINDARISFVEYQEETFANLGGRGLRSGLMHFSEWEQDDESADMASEDDYIFDENWEVQEEYGRAYEDTKVREVAANDNDATTKTKAAEEGALTEPDLGRSPNTPPERMTTVALSNFDDTSRQRRLVWQTTRRDWNPSYIAARRVAKKELIDHANDPEFKRGRKQKRNTNLPRFRKRNRPQRQRINTGGNRKNTNSAMNYFAMTNSNARTNSGQRRVVVKVQVLGRCYNCSPENGSVLLDVPIGFRRGRRRAAAQDLDQCADDLLRALVNGNDPDYFCITRVELSVVDPRCE